MRRRGAEVYIELPEGDGGGPGSRQCGLLRKSLYGTRDAAQKLGMRAWRILGGDRFAQGTSEHVPVLEEARGISASVMVMMSLSRPQGKTLSG